MSRFILSFNAFDPVLGRDLLRKRRDIFWFRFFGLEPKDENADRFCEALWLHLRQEFKVKTPDVKLFTTLLKNVLGLSVDRLIIVDAVELDVSFN